MLDVSAVVVVVEHADGALAGEPAGRTVGDLLAGLEGEAARAQSPDRALLLRGAVLAQLGRRIPSAPSNRLAGYSGER